MAEVARFNSILRNNQTKVVLKIEGRDERTINTPVDLALLHAFGPILKFDLCVKQYSYLQSRDPHGRIIPWRFQLATQPIILNRRSEFPAAQAWTYLTDIISSVALIPGHILNDTVLRISNYAFMSYNPTTLVIHVKASLAVVNIINMVERPPVRPLLARRNTWVRVDDSIQSRSKSVMDLKERYGFISSETEADDDLGDCVVCLEELDVTESDVLKMPCSHVFHCNCIFKWLQQSDCCPLCRSVIH